MTVNTPPCNIMLCTMCMDGCMYRRTEEIRRTNGEEKLNAMAYLDLQQCATSFGNLLLNPRQGSGTVRTPRLSCCAVYVCCEQYEVWAGERHQARKSRWELLYAARLWVPFSCFLREHTCMRSRIACSLHCTFARSCKAVPERKCCAQYSLLHDVEVPL